MQFKHMQEGIISVIWQNIGELYIFWRVIYLWALENGFSLPKINYFMKRNLPLTFNICNNVQVMNSLLLIIRFVFAKILSSRILLILS